MNTAFETDRMDRVSDQEMERPYADDLLAGGIGDREMERLQQTICRPVASLSGS